jgi:hypothetical protein
MSLRLLRSILAAATVATATAAAAAAAAAVISPSSRAGMVVVRQGTDSVGHIEFMSADTGAVQQTSSLAFPFSWPYVQLTSDIKSGTTYLTAFPDGFSYPALYVLDRDLVVMDSLEHAAFTWWDLQCSPRQETLYGILVTQDFNGGMYGRTLSNYTYNSNGTADASELTLEVTELFLLPYMWYVNASSIDQTTDTYFALANNFPGHDNSTTEQKLIVADFSLPMQTAEPTDQEESVLVLDLELGDVMAQFIAFSTMDNTLYFSGPSKTPGAAGATVGVLCQEHGKIERVLFASSGDVSLVGPLVADDAQERLLFFIQQNDKWNLMEVGYMENSVPSIVEAYMDVKSFAAAVHMLA